MYEFNSIHITILTKTSTNNLNYLPLNVVCFRLLLSQIAFTLYRAFVNLSII